VKNYKKKLLYNNNVLLYLFFTADIIMTIENASPFFAWDVSSYLALFLISAFLIVTLDQLFFNKSNTTNYATPNKTPLYILFYFYALTKMRNT